MIMRSNLPELPTEKMNLSFSGCGFLGLYHMGVACCFRQYCPQICQNQISGASAGALVATALACNLNLGKSASHILEVAIKARHRALGPFHPNFDINEIMLRALNNVLPPDAHELVNGKLNISVTRVIDGKNCILTDFTTRSELIQAILCSCFIPFWSGYIPPKFRGVAYIDGGFSNNLLILDQHTVTISPFSGESDICPLDSTYNAFQINISNTSISISPGNIYRLTRILFPPHPEVMDKMCQQGFHDALRFLQRHNKISCTRCIAVQSAYTVEHEEEDEEEEEEVDPLISKRDDVDEDDASINDEEDEAQLLDEVEQQNEKGGLFKKRLDELSNSLEQLIKFGLNERLPKNEELADDEMEQQMQKLVDLNKRIHVESREPAKKRSRRRGGVSSFKNHAICEDCGECDTLQNQVICNHPLPENVADASQEACDKVNKGLINYIFKFRIVKIMSTLSLPYVLPFDITLVLLNRLRKVLPLLGRELAKSLKRVVQRILKLLSGMDGGRAVSESCLANFRYQVAVTEFDYSNEQNSSPTKERSLSRKVSSASCATPELDYEGRLTDRKPLEKSHSFKISRNRSNEDLARNSPCKYSIDGRQRFQRKSYAGSEQYLSKSGQERKVSMIDVLACKPSERVLSKMNLGFSMDLNDIANMQSRGEVITPPIAQLTPATSAVPVLAIPPPPPPSPKILNPTPDVVESSLIGAAASSSKPEQAADDTDSNLHRLSLAAPAPSFISNASTNEPTTNVLEEQAIQIANQALNKGIDDLSVAEPKLDRLNNRLREITTSKGPMLAFHYKDDNNVVKVTEIFNFSDEDGEERRSQSDLSLAEPEDDEKRHLDGGQASATFDVFGQEEETSESMLSRRGSVSTPLDLNSWASDDSLDLSTKYDEDEENPSDQEKGFKRQRKTNYIARQ